VLVLLLLIVTQGGAALPLPAPKLLGLNPPVPNQTMPSQSIEWMQEAPVMDAIWWYVYRVYLDGEKTGKQLGGLVCKGTYTPFHCSAALPNITTTVGKHTLTLSVAKFISGDSVQYPSQTGPESWSNPVEFMVRQPPPKMYIETPYNPPPVVIK
jgi:hypothetical protein